MLRSIYQILVVLLFLTILCGGATAHDLPNITAQAWLLADQDGKIIEGTHTTDKRSIASITKLMTVIVVLDSGQALDQLVSKKIFNRQVDRQTLIDLAIVKSNNAAARMLCDAYPGGLSACVEAMNAKARSLGMEDTHFTDPTGLYQTNESTAEDLVKLVMAAKDYHVIVAASNKSTVKWQVSKKKSIEFHNTNSLVGHGIEFLVSKTGWINKSGGCIVMMLNTIHGIRTVILLGSKNTKTRIPEAYQVSMISKISS